MEKLKQLKKGDIIKIEFADGISKAKVIENHPETEKIYLKIKYLPFWIWPHYKIKKYDSYSFDNFDVLNPGYGK